jgi:hypothetical protein
MKTFLPFVLAGALAGPAPQATAAPFAAPTLLDAGPGPGAAPGLSAADRFAPARGFGWVRAPEADFAHASFAGVRPRALVDGVSGRDLTLRLELRPGRWTALVFLDDGWRDAHATVIEWDGRPAPHSARRFGVEEEPEAPPINRYRVAAAEFSSTGTTHLRLAHPEGQVRLLALHLLPMDWTESDETRWIRDQVGHAGRPDFRAPLDGLRAELGREGGEPSRDACAAYWKAHLDLLAEAESWHRLGGWDHVTDATRSSMFTRYRIANALLDPLVEHPAGEAFPLRERALWLRARLLYWLNEEQHLPADRAAFRRDIAALRARFPADELIAMYAGAKVPANVSLVPPDPAAPAWSRAQAEALQRLRDVAGYWIEERQAPNGEFGGKTDDDVELLRWWSILIFAGDTRVRDAFERLAQGIWFSPRIHLGYSRVARDVEHSAEFISDTVPMMALATRRPEWIERLGWSHRHMRDLWTARNAQGDLLFRSAWIGATEVLSEPPRNRDLSMNARAAKAVRYHAWLTGDPEARALLRDWSLAWAKAAAGAEKGKPRGLFPASLRWPDGAVNGDEPTWHRANMFWHYFEWTGDGRLYDQLLFSWLQTGEARLLQPMRDTLALLARTAATPAAPEGSAAWAAAALGRSAEFWNVVTQWRLETGETEFDELLRRHGPPYLVFRLTGDSSGLARAIEETTLDVLRFNRPLRTSEVLFTDRIHVSEERGNVSGLDLLKAMLTGCHSAEGMSPYHHAAWEEAPAGFTALVTETGGACFAADLFVHGASDGEGTVRLLRLPAGEYRLRVSANDGVLGERVIRIGKPDHRERFPLPAGKLVRLEVRPVGTAAGERR